MGSVPIVLRVKGLDKAHHVLRRLYHGGVTLANKAAAREVASHVRRAVQERYLVEGGHPPHAPGTIQTYRQGKFGYDGPHSWNLARRKRIAARPYFRTGRLANAVVITVIKDIFRIEINPRLYYGAGADPGDRHLPLWHVAALLEYPRPVVIPMTLRMLAYLKVLQRGTGGQSPSRRRLPDIKLGKAVVIRPRKREVWQWVARRIQKFKGPYWRALQQRIQLILRDPTASQAMSLGKAISTRKYLD